MFWNKKRKRLVASLFVIILCFVNSSSPKAYLTTNRDTRTAPESVTYDLERFDEYELLYETDTLKYFFREDRDVLAILDKRSGYTWKTGLDLPFSKEADARIDSATEEEKKTMSKEKGLNTTYIALANSLISVEYYELETIKNISSASEKGASSKLYTIDNDPARRRLDIDFTSIDLQMKVYLNLKENGFQIEIPFEEITGEGKSVLASVMLAPFLGASGGEEEVYNEETKEVDLVQAKYRKPGYILVPDGSGTLIRFYDNSVAFSQYNGDVYGKDPATETYYYDMLYEAVPLKSPVMPVFGIAHGNNQAAFVAYADKGAEYMDIVVSPDENRKVKYTWAYPRFEYNMTYFQVYNKKGAGYFTMMENPNQFDISMSYEFLEGDGTDGTPAADYTGMAALYRKHLVEIGALTEGVTPEGDIPIRLDFLMADSKKGVVGTEEVVVTTVKDVREILTDVRELNISNVNSGLIGWQKNGEVLSKPWKIKYSGKIGNKKEFQKLFTDFLELGIDISYSRDFSSINKQMLNYYGNAAKHVNTWYLDLDQQDVLPSNAPVTYKGYGVPAKSASWVKTVAKAVKNYSTSLTLEGISDTLVSHFDRNGPVTTLPEAVAIYQETLEEIGQDLNLNLVNPNMYLWKYTDRYLQAPVGGSQYVFETDSVPFLQMVLHGTMEVYGPYSNFSFYTKPDILRMIDYNLSPSFILTKNPSYYLSDTASSNYFSTEYKEYRSLIKEVYEEVNGVLKQVAGLAWTERRVPEDGVVINSYQGQDGKKAFVIINYTDVAVTYLETKVEPLTAVVVR